MTDGTEGQDMEEYRSRPGKAKMKADTDMKDGTGMSGAGSMAGGDDIRIAVASTDQAEEILGIYAPYVEKTAISFEYEVPSAEEFRGRMEKTLQNYPYLTAERGGQIIGYAYTGAFVGRKAYSWSAETTIYIRTDERKSGVGRRLYEALEEVSKAQHILNLNACIGIPAEEDAYLTKNSMEFHAHMGYAPVGVFHRSGYKFGRWYDMIWMEKMLGEHVQKPEEVILFPRLDPQVLRQLGIQMNAKA